MIKYYNLKDKLITTLTPEDIVIFYDTIDNANEEVQFVCYLIFNNINDIYVPNNPKKTRTNIKNILIANGWTHYQIYKTFKQISNMFKKGSL